MAGQGGGGLIEWGQGVMIGGGSGGPDKMGGTES